MTIAELYELAVANGFENDPVECGGVDEWESGMVQLFDCVATFCSAKSPTGQVVHLEVSNRDVPLEGEIWRENFYLD